MPYEDNDKLLIETKLFKKLPQDIIKYIGTFLTYWPDPPEMVMI